MTLRGIVCVSIAATAFAVTAGACKASPSTDAVRPAETGAPSAPMASALLVEPEAEASALPTEAGSPVRSIDGGTWVAATRSDGAAIYTQPSFGSPLSGQLRAGVPVRRSPSPLPDHSSCRDGWYAVEPSGFVCASGEWITLDPASSPVVAAASTHPARLGEPFPFGYGTSYGAPLYRRVPTDAEVAEQEKDRASVVAQLTGELARMPAERRPDATALPLGPVPPFLEGGAEAPALDGAASGGVRAGWAWQKMRLAFVAAFEAGGRPYYLTTENRIVPADRVRPARLADFHGVELAPAGQAGEHLPLAWVRWKPAVVYRIEDGHAVPTGDTLGLQSHWSIATKERVVSGTRLYEQLDPDGQPTGLYVRSDVMTRVDGSTSAPWGVAADEVWIGVSIDRQVMVVYRGVTPLFATLVSTGVDGDGDPETTRSTPIGSFRIESKHWTHRMKAEEHAPWKEGGEPEPRFRIDDIPHVQYFHEGFAFHAAYWHDDFGAPRSHGCINLSPRDAAWLFGVTAPAMPEGWWGVYAGREPDRHGTVVVVGKY